jgi:F-type H+-transporting ATPase subunit a
MLQFFAEAKSPHVSLPAEEIFSIGGFPITNALIYGVIGYGLVIWMLFYVAGKVKRGQKNRFVSLIQWIFEALYSTVLEVTGDKKVTRRLAPLAITMFFFIIVNYWLGILPFVGPVTWHHTPLFRSLAADLNTTFALAIITIVMAQIYAIQHHGFRGNLGRYFRNPAKDVAGAFEGILELIAEFSRLMGLSLRLFGNVFAGEILLMMIAFLTVYATPVALPPFYIFELFIGAVQAYIFFMLTVVFISLGLASHGHDDHSDDHSTVDTTKPTLATGGNEK